MRNAFREGQPLIFAGGHDHSLQIIQHTEFPWPKYSMVSGTGSKVSNVGHIEGMMYRKNAAGYMRIVTHRNGRVDMFVTAAPDEHFMTCSGEGTALEQCMNEGAARYTTQFGLRVK
jgi:hypothetical protein